MQDDTSSERPVAVAFRLAFTGRESTYGSISLNSLQKENFPQP